MCFNGIFNSARPNHEFKLKCKYAYGEECRPHTVDILETDTDFDLIAEYDYETSGNFTTLCMREGKFCQYVLARTWSPQYKSSVEDMTLQSN